MKNNLNKRKPTRPLHAIAYSVATASNSIPLRETIHLTTLLQNVNDNAYDNVLDLNDSYDSKYHTLQTVSAFLEAIGIHNKDFQSAFFELCQIQSHSNHNTTNDTENDNSDNHHADEKETYISITSILTCYGVLRRLAYTKITSANEFRRAAEDAVWLVFAVAAVNGPIATTVTLEEWERVSIVLGEGVGGVDSPPSEVTLQEFRNTWKQLQRPMNILTTFTLSVFLFKRKGELKLIDGLCFDDLLIVLRSFDAGLIVALRAIGVIMANSVRKSIPRDRRRGSKIGNHEILAIPDLDEYATLLSQFVILMLEKSKQDQLRYESNKDNDLDNSTVLESGEIERDLGHSDGEANGSTINTHQNQETEHFDSNFAMSEGETIESNEEGASMVDENAVDESGLSPSASNFSGANATEDHIQTPLSSSPRQNFPHLGDTVAKKQMDIGNNDIHLTRSAESNDLAFNNKDSVELTSKPPLSPLSRLTNASMVRRSNGKRKGKTPFHIDFASLELGELIGHGAKGEVYRATYLMSPVAVKVFRVNLHKPSFSHDLENKDLSGDNVEGKNDLMRLDSSLQRMSTVSALRKYASRNSQSKYYEFVREVELMSVVRHPNLVLYMGACGDPFTPLCIVSELFTGGSLHDYLHKDSSFHPSLNIALSVTLHIARGMHYLHSSKPSILHRDLKARNVLLSGQRDEDGAPHVVICDFGLCQLLGEDRDSVNNGLAQGQEQQMGTTCYMSPNAINGEKYTAMDDVYSFGILVHEIFTGCRPYAGMRPIEIIYQVANNGLRPKSENDMEIIPEPVYKLIEKCWDQERDKRPHFDTIINILDDIIRSRLNN